MSRTGRFLVILVGLSGCSSIPMPPLLTPTPDGPLATRTPSPPPADGTPPACPLETPWSLSFDLSGGFAGLDRRLEIDSTGRAIAIDHQAQAREEFNLSGTERAELDGQMGVLCEAEASDRLPMCADCFVYHLRFQGGASQFELTANDVSLQQSPAAGLFDLLRVWMDAALAGAP